MASPTYPLETERLLLRPFRDDDKAAFAALNADPEVRAFFPGTLTREESDLFVARIDRSFAERGFGFFAVEAKGVAAFLGFCGLAVPAFDHALLPTEGTPVEIGWRLSRAAWGKGYATEAARASLALGFGPLGLREIVSFTVPANVRSRRVMERIGMTHEPEHDFDHPALPEGHTLRRHVFYRIAVAR